MKSEIAIMRHGLTTGNIGHFYYGSSDIPLAKEGEEELLRLTRQGIYPLNDTAEFFTTGMLRTEQTLNIIYGGREHRTIPELKELDFGDFEMQDYQKVENDPVFSRWISAEDGGAPPPNAEDIEHFIKRINKGFEILKNYNAERCFELRNRGVMPLSICVCHGGSISVIMHSIWPDKREKLMDWIPDPGHGYLLTLTDGAVTDAEAF